MITPTTTNSFIRSFFISECAAPKAPGNRLEVCQNSNDATVTSVETFPSGLDWLNTDEPLTLSNLRGKLLILDFWTYC